MRGRKVSKSVAVISFRTKFETLYLAPKPMTRKRNVAYLGWGLVAVELLGRLCGRETDIKAIRDSQRGIGGEDLVDRHREERKAEKRAGE